MDHRQIIDQVQIVAESRLDIHTTWDIDSDVCYERLRHRLAYLFELILYLGFDVDLFVSLTVVVDICVRSIFRAKTLNMLRRISQLAVPFAAFTNASKDSCVLE